MQIQCFVFAYLGTHDYFAQYLGCYDSIKIITIPMKNETLSLNSCILLLTYFQKAHIKIIL